MTDRRRTLPSVDRILRDPAMTPVLARWPHHLVADAVRATIDEVRLGTRPAPPTWPAAVADLLRQRAIPSLRPVINATGVVLHTNLGRAPLARAAVAAAVGAAGYGTVEYDLASGERGSRHDHCAEPLRAVTGAEAGIAVNNAAGALLLAVNTAAAGREVIVSRGELIEIGGSFRIPDILARSGATLREVGTTNRTHLRDYAEAIGERTGALLTVHRSNFEQRGFVASPPPAELAALAGAHGLPYLHDTGSGLLHDLSAWGLTGEPLVSVAVRDGASLVLFSGDKLLGGPQAGCLVGQTEWVARCRRNPLARALRADKVTLAALEATLALHRDPALAIAEIPVLRMLVTPHEALAARAREIADRLAPMPWPAAPPRLLPGASTPGGGSFPGATLPTTLVALDPGATGADPLLRSLRLGTPPVIGRIENGLVVLDPRTLLDDDLDPLVAAIAAAIPPAS